MFQNCKAITPKTAPLNKIIEAIINGKYKNQVENVRSLFAESKKEEASNFKISNIPVFTPSGVFENGKKDCDIVAYNKLIILDLDNIPTKTFDQIFHKAKEISFTLVCFRSPSGNGLKILVPVTSELTEHGLAFSQVKSYYEEVLNFEIDPSGKNASRLCIMSYDPDGYLNDEVDIFPVKVLKNTAEEVKFFKDFATALKWTDDQRKFVQGQRNNYIYYLACNCNKLGIEKDRALKSILSKFKSENNTEYIKSINSAYKGNAYEFGDKKIKSEPKALIKTEVVAEVAEVANVVQQATTRKWKSFKELAEIGKTLKPLKKIFGNYILEGSTTLFPSERGVGKSLLAVQIAIMVASGKQEYLGERIELSGNVLYINLELGETTTALRMSKMHTDLNIKSEYHADCMTSNSGLEPIQNDIIQYVKENKPVLIIIDNLRTAFSNADNEKNKDMTKAIMHINKLKSEWNCSFLIVHHTKKGTGKLVTDSDMQSGAGALTDLVDADFFLRKSCKGKNLRLLKRIKARECEEQEGAKLIELSEGSLWFDFLEENVNEIAHIQFHMESPEKKKEKAFELKNQGLNNNQISKEVDVDRATVGRWFK